MIPGLLLGRPLVLLYRLLFVDAVLYGTRCCGSTRVVDAGRGVCAGSAGVTAG